MADGAERSLFLVDGETGDGVVAAVGDIDEFPRRVNLDIGGGFLPLDASLRQGGNGLARGERGERFDESVDAALLPTDQRRLGIESEENRVRLMILFRSMTVSESWVNSPLWRLLQLPGWRVGVFWIRLSTSWAMARWM